MSLRRQPSSICTTVKDHFLKIGMNASCVSSSGFDGEETSATDGSTTLSPAGSSIHSSTLYAPSTESLRSSSATLSVSTSDLPGIAASKPQHSAVNQNRSLPVGCPIMDRHTLVKMVEGHMSASDSLTATQFPASPSLDSPMSSGLTPPPWHARARAQSSCARDEASIGSAVQSTSAYEGGHSIPSACTRDPDVRPM
ncbi:hypothetical protein PHLGIDRAFT_254145 [Phlebiopsis gigantea 11061_1 CR5-6]|uniref:Uncharacterized protein n=1 Tax=Phlebiopsis gigantea (strain 11061_1 CR5-6) TaxID=745531 RepID=A0A0C3PD44_PHLG1|nr:hypothetical protein PHLGIDRAFT_254145 [Phlebiopsis gigantea 11061_1 CR5-6]